jgi:hypothetical protein
MSFARKLQEEIRAVVLTTLFFLAWIGVLMLLKVLILDEYHIEFRGFSLALIGALVLAKVVLVFELVPLGAWISARPAWVEVVVRTALYSLGVLVVLLAEKAFESRHEHGGFIAALFALYRHVDLPHVWANAIVLSGALLAYNATNIVRLKLGEGGLRAVFLSPTPKRESKRGEGR